jgi:MerR family mercuric resistance operon transcriptional regulator
MKPLTIGQLANRAGVGVETVRFYEREGLLDEPARRGSGYRQYTENVVGRLRFIRRTKELGFTLKEIKELLSLRLDPSTTCADVRTRAQAKIADIEEKIRTLQRMKKALVKVTDSCSGRGPTSECPILEAFDSDCCDGKNKTQVRRALGNGAQGSANTVREGVPR